MEANIQNELDIQLFRLNLGRCIDIATRWSLKGIKKNITDATPYSVFGSYLEPQMDYFENFKRALRLEFDNPQNGKGFEIDIKSKFLPMINRYYEWYDKHKSETTIFEPDNFYEWIYQIAKDTEQEINKYFQIYSNEDDNTNPLIFDKDLITGLHNNFRTFIFETTDIDDFENYFKQTPKKINYRQGITIAVLCYFFSKIEHLQTGVSTFSEWMKYHIGNNNYKTKKNEFIEMAKNAKLKRNGFSLTVPQKKALANKEKIDNLFKRMQID
jgi:hypothetical protein